MSRAAAIARAHSYFDSGEFLVDLRRRVAIPSTSQEPERAPALRRYLDDEMVPSLAPLGFTSRILDNPSGPPFLVAERMEDDAAVTVLIYGHGDTVRGLDDMWRGGLSPWALTVEGTRLYGRGTADNKGQHSVNIAALAAVIAERGRLGFNAKILIEMGEEVGSAGLRELCAKHKDKLLQADLLIASDGPRIAPDRPTMFLGARGGHLIDMVLNFREGGHHSGNWGGLLANPGIVIAHALACITDARGQIKVPEWRPKTLTNSIRAALADAHVDAGEGAPEINEDWGEKGLTPVERVFGWNSFEVLAFKTGNPDRPVNAIPPSAIAYCQLRFVVGTDPHEILPALRRHLDSHGFPQIELEQARDVIMNATRPNPENPWAKFAATSIEKTGGQKPNMLPNLGGSLPNEVFTDILGMPTVWVPHSYAACSQHAPNEHLLAPVVRDGLRLMTGIFWDLGAQGRPG